MRVKERIAVSVSPTAPIIPEVLLYLFHPLQAGREVRSGWKLVDIVPGKTIRARFTYRNAPTLELGILPRNDEDPAFERSRWFNFSVLDAENPLPESVARFARLMVELVRRNSDSEPRPVFWDNLKRKYAIFDDENARSFDIEASPHCQNRCRFCINRPAGIPATSTEALLDLLRQQREKGAQGVEFTAMEPTLRPDILDLVAEAKRLGYGLIRMISNGYGFAKEGFTPKIFDAGLHLVTLSILGHRPEIETILTTRSDSFEIKARALAHIVEATGSRREQWFGERALFSNTVITKQNQDNLPDILDYLDRSQVSSATFSFPEPGGWALEHFDEVMPSLAAIKDVAALLLTPREEGPLASLLDLPLCVVRGEEVRGRTRKMLLSSTGEEGWREGWTEKAGRKIKPKEPCGRCRLAGECPGVWSEYVKRRGSGELTPFP